MPSPITAHSVNLLYRTHLYLYTSRSIASINYRLLGSRTLALYSRSLDTMNLEGLWSHGFVSLRIFWIIFHFTQRIPKPTKLKINKLKGPREDLETQRNICPGL